MIIRAISLCPGNALKTHYARKSETEEVDAWGWNLAIARAAPDGGMEYREAAFRVVTNEWLRTVQFLWVSG